MSQCSKFLRKTSKIRWHKPSKNKLLIHAADWHNYWTEHDRQRDELLDNKSVQEEIAHIEARKAEARTRKDKERGK